MYDMNNKEIGAFGEQKALQYLKSRKYDILTQNYRCRYGEIDLIAKYKNTLVFVEVKTRRSQKYGKGMEAVNFTKMQKIRKTALYYLKDKSIKFDILRFDVIDIFIDSTGSITLEHIKNAF